VSIAAAVGTSPPTNLVPRPTSFVGREAQLEAVHARIQNARLVTVTGPPGAGKTRLAETLAMRMLGEFDGGAWLVELAPLRDSTLVLSATADAIGVLAASSGPPLEAIAARVAGRPTLLILDNFEHVLAAADDVANLLAAAPDLSILVTSRTLLHLSGEHEYPLAPLELPAAGAGIAELATVEAVELFARRAAAADPRFEVTEANAEHVGELCRRLDGLPLALELAAARVKLLPVPAMMSRFEHRLPLLSGGSRDVPARHRSLRAAVAWSYELLDPGEQQLFRKLSVFRGGWTFEEAAAMRDGSDAEEALDDLAALLDSSLIVRDVTDDVVPRFTMLETLREFAAEQLVEAGEDDAARARHASLWIGIAAREAPLFVGTDAGTALDRFARDHDNVRAAFAYLLETDPAAALQLGSTVWRFWQMRGHLIEGEELLRAALGAAAEKDSATVRADALSALGSLVYWRGDIAGAKPFYEEALAIRRTLDDDSRTAAALYDLAFMFVPYFFPPPADPERTAHGVTLLQEAVERYHRLDDASGIAKTGWMLGNFMLYRDLREAELMLRTAVEQFRALDDPFGLGWALRMHGCALLGVADTATARAEFRHALGLFRASGDGSALGILLGDLAEVARIEGDGHRAAQLRGAAAGLRQETEAALANVADVPWLAGTRPLEEIISAAEIEAAAAAGRAMTQSEAIAFALDETEPPTGGEALAVTALGPFVVERAGTRVTGWGGPKAGSRQAQAMFAFLLDRGERGVAKDEFIEVIWPDADVAQGDLNFHRTLGGLRATLEPERGDEPSSSVTFANGRYRLNPGIVGNQDVDEFERDLRQAAQATDESAAIRHLEDARAVYRADYLDDCPIYGDSEYVEERRTALRGRLLDALIDLGRRYERRGETLLAADRYREALAVAGGDITSAGEGLERLGVSVS
jgi:predicted ATPase/DNA-binding SARP family transcriptional activator